MYVLHNMLYLRISCVYLLISITSGVLVQCFWLCDDDHDVSGSNSVPDNHCHLVMQKYSFNSVILNHRRYSNICIDRQYAGLRVDKCKQFLVFIIYHVKSS